MHLFVPPTLLRLATALLIGACTAVPAAGPQPSGRLWHSDSSIGRFKSGTYVSAISGAKTGFVTDYRFSALDRTGEHLIQDDYDATTGNERTAVKVFDTRTNRLQSSITVDGYLTEMRWSPANNGWLLARWATDFIAARHTVVLDLTGKLLFATADAADVFDWLPDGRLVRVGADGTIGTQTVGGPEVRIASIRWPAGWEPGRLFAGPDGQRLALRMDSTTSKDHDLWVMSLGGQDLQRFTKTQMATYAVWSPDGQYLAFNRNSGFSCSDSDCRGSCRIWYAPATARNVVAVESSNDAYPFTVTTVDGSRTRLGCDLLAWTP